MFPFYDLTNLFNLFLKFLDTGTVDIFTNSINNFCPNHRCNIFHEQPCQHFTLRPLIQSPLTVIFQFQNPIVDGFVSFGQGFNRKTVFNIQWTSFKEVRTNRRKIHRAACGDCKESGTDGDVSSVNILIV